MRNGMMCFDGLKRRPAMIVSIPPKSIRAAVIFEHSFRMTSLPIPLSQCPKKRHVISCTIRIMRSNKIDEVIGTGFSFCRPPDKFNQEEGATRAFRRAVDSFCRSGRFINYYSHELDVRRSFWNQFRKTKAWKRVVCAKKAREA